MNHYEKLTIVLLRGLACSVLLFAMCGVASALLSRAFSNDVYVNYLNIYYVLGYAVYGVAGLALFALSKPLAILIARRM